MVGRPEPVAQPTAPHASRDGPHEPPEARPSVAAWPPQARTLARSAPARSRIGSRHTNPAVQHRTPRAANSRPMSKQAPEAVDQGQALGNPLDVSPRRGGEVTCGHIE